MLAQNERTTFSHALLAGSQAIDAGSCELATDQRGAGRPQGQGCDIGAIEHGGMGNEVFLPLVRG
jgi:hypothetical protein